MLRDISASPARHFLQRVYLFKYLLYVLTSYVSYIPASDIDHAFI